MIIIEGVGIGPQDPTKEQVKGIPVGALYCFIYKQQTGPDGTWYRWTWPWKLDVFRHSGNFTPWYDRVYRLSGIHTSRKAALKAAHRIFAEDAELRS